MHHIFNNFLKMRLLVNNNVASAAYTNAISLSYIQQLIHCDIVVAGDINVSDASSPAHLSLSHCIDLSHLAKGPLPDDIFEIKLLSVYLVPVRVVRKLVLFCNDGPSVGCLFKNLVKILTCTVCTEHRTVYQGTSSRFLRHFGRSDLNCSLGEVKNEFVPT